MSKKGAQKRTEEDAVLQTPLVVKLGGKEYRVRLLTLRESAEWRRQFVKVTVDLPQQVTVPDGTPAGYKVVMDALFNLLPEKAIELFFAYAKDLDKEEIMDSANDAEMAIAFKEVCKQGNPLSTALVGAITAISR